MKRCRFEIIASLLDAAKNGAKKTWLLYDTNLQYARQATYMEEIEKFGLIEKTYDERGKQLYKTTKRGLDFLFYFDKANKLLEGFEKIHGSKDFIQ